MLSARISPSKSSNLGIGFGNPLPYLCLNQPLGSRLIKWNLPTGNLDLKLDTTKSTKSKVITFSKILFSSYCVTYINEWQIFKWVSPDPKYESLSHVWLFVTPMDCSSQGSSIQRILQARILERVAISFSRGTSWPMDRTWVSCLQVDSLPLRHQGNSSPYQTPFKKSSPLKLIFKI